MAHPNEKPSDRPEIEIEAPRASEVRAVDAAKVDELKIERSKVHKRLRDDAEKGARQMHDYFEDEVA